MNSPLASVIAWTIFSASPRSAPAIDYPTAANPPVVGVHVPVDAVAGDALILQWSQSETFASGISSGSYTLLDTTLAGSTVAIGIPTLSTGAPWYFRARVTIGGTWSSTVAWNDATAPTISTSTTASQMELFPLSVTLAANKTVGWSITGGADQVYFEISGTTLRWYGNGTRNYDVPEDVDANNTYVVQVTATDLAGNATNKTITVTTTAADKTPDAFSFTDVIPATPSTVYTSNTITLSGMTASIDIPATVTGAGTYSKNSGAFVAAGSFTVRNGDTIALRTTSGSGGSSVVNMSLSIGITSDTWTVSNTSNTAAWTSTNGTSKNSNVTVSGTPPLSISTANTSALQLVRANAAASSKRYFEFTVDAGTAGEMFVGIDDGTVSFGPTTTVNPPGNATSTGLSFNNGSWGWEIKTASTVLFSDYASGTKALAVGDKIGFEFDTTAHTCQVWRKKSGSWASLGTVSTGFNLSAYYAFAGNAATSGVINGTANFGATAFDRTPSAGYVGYGS